jgi:hypothetical protein
MLLAMSRAILAQTAARPRPARGARAARRAAWVAALWLLAGLPQASPAAPPAAEAWQADGTPDGGQDGTPAARSPLVDGATVGVFRAPDGVWLYLRGPAGRALGARAPAILVDGRSVRDLEPLARRYAALRLGFVRRTSRWFAIQVWGGAGAPPEPLASLLSGRELEVRWYGQRDEPIAVRFPLAGAAAALRPVLTPAPGERPPAAEDEALRATTVALSKACIDRSGAAGPAACLDRVVACASASVDAADLLDCAAAPDGGAAPAPR